MKLPDLGVAMAAITKNEGPFIAEWVAYHYLLGVEHFIIYDNGSTDGSAAVATAHGAPLRAVTPAAPLGELAIATGDALRLAAASCPAASVNTASRR